MEDEDQNITTNRRVNEFKNKGAVPRLPKLDSKSTCSLLGDFERAPTLQHAMIENDNIYNELMMRLNCLKENPPKRKLKKEDTSVSEDDFMTSLAKRRGANVKDLLENISRLDSEMSLQNEALEGAKKERLEVQEEMCHVLSELDVSSKTSETFLQLCHFEKESVKDEEDDEENAKPEELKNKSSDQVKKQKKNDSCEKNFVVRNIELAKRHSMAQVSLTDEEKIKLETLLSDIGEQSPEDMNEKCGKRVLKPIDKILPRDETNSCKETEDSNYFQLHEEEQKLLQDLDVKLNEILESYENVEINSRIKSKTDDVQDDNEGRFWKQHHLQKRLEIIERDLASIAAKDAEEQKPKEKQKESDDQNHPTENSDEEKL